MTSAVQDAAPRHGYVGGSQSDVRARAAIRENAGLGSAQYEPQSLEAPKGFPQSGPADGRLASAGGKFGGTLDAAGRDRWIKNSVSPGTIRVEWTYTARHRTSQWRYFLTRPGWNPEAPLSRAQLDLTPVTTITHDGSMSQNGVVHHVRIPTDRSGYHVLYAVWDVGDTSNAFYNAIDLDVYGEPDVDANRPSRPERLQAVHVAADVIDLEWAPSTDDTGVNGYSVYRDGHKVGEVITTSYSDTAVTAGRTYVYAVQAFDGAGNVSELSASLTVTAADTGPVDPDHPDNPDDPGTPTGPVRPPVELHTMDVTDTSVDLMWAPADGGSPAVGYTVERALGSGAFTAVGTSSRTRFVDSGLEPGTTYRYRVVARDACDRTATGEVLTVTTSSSGGGGGDHPEWSPVGAYTIGDRVQHDGLVYVCIQSYRGNGDPNWIFAPSLWKLVG